MHGLGIELSGCTILDTKKRTQVVHPISSLISVSAFPACKQEETAFLHQRESTPKSQGSKQTAVLFASPEAQTENYGSMQVLFKSTAANTKIRYYS